MSEYQHHEFLAIDLPLTAEELAYVRTLSWRIRLARGGNYTEAGTQRNHNISAASP